MINGSKVLDHPIRWAMVGGGKGSQIGYIHRSAALRDNNFQLVAGAFDINPERGMAFAAELGIDPDRCYPDYKTMFEKEAQREDGIEAVSIATPNSVHYEVCKAALEAGIHVVCEKPLCFSTEEGEELVALAKKKNLVVGVTYGYSGHQMIQQARQMIKNGDLGDIRVINMSFAFGGYNYKIEETNAAAKWRFDPKKAGPSFAMADVGTHCLYIIEAMIPDMKIDKVLCSKDAFVEGRELEDNAFTLMRLNGSEHVQEGAKVYCWSSSINCGARHGHVIRVVGSKASIEREIQRCCGIQEACSQTSQAAVAQGSILYFFHVGQFETALVKQLFYFIVNTKAKQIVIDCTANQKFCGHIICMACFSVQLLAFLPRSGDLCHNCFGKSMMNILCIGLVEILAAVTLQVYFHLFHQFGTIHSVYHLSLYSRQRGFCLRGFGSGSAALLHLTYAIHPLYAPYVDMIIAYHFDVFNKKIIKPCNFLVHMYCL